MSYVFLDESGEFKKRDQNEYFVIGAFTIGNPRKTQKQFRSWQHSHFPKKMRYQSEIKFADILIDEKLRINTLRFFSELDIRIRYTYLLRDNIPQEYRDKNKIKSGYLYTHIISETLQAFTPIHDREFRVFCDNRHLKGITKAKFKEDLTASLLPKLPKGVLLQIETVDSTTNENIQIADWIAGSIAKYYNKKPLGEELYTVLKNNILSGEELFKDYWFNKQKTQPNG